MSNAGVVDKTEEGHGEPFFWFTRPTAEQMALMTAKQQAVEQPVTIDYWQEPPLTESDLFPDVLRSTTTGRYQGPILAPLATYRNCTEF